MNALHLRSPAITTVAALSALFGTVLVQSIATITAGLEAAGNESPLVRNLLASLSTVFFGIALYVGAIVTANVVSTVLSGRIREIALLRLVGASSASLRRSIVRAGLVQGALGSLIGCVIGLVLMRVGVELAFTLGGVQRFAAPVVSPGLVAPVLGVMLATMLAARIGSRLVLTVSPVQAAGSTVEKPWRERRRIVRLILAVVVALVGAALLAVGAFAGSVTPIGVIIAFVGGVVSSAGIVIGAPVIVPPALRLVGLAMGRGPVAVLASRNAVRDPVRASRAAVGLGIGVTLVTTFATGLEEFRIVARQLDMLPKPEELDRMVDSITGYIVVLVGFSALLAAVGMVSTLLQSVLQRRRELGLLRALGFTTGQIRRMVSAEAIQVVVASTVLGILLGSLYGWAGSLAAFGSLSRSPLPFLIPVDVAVGITLATAVIALVSSLVAARAATKVTPVEALADV